MRTLLILLALPLLALAQPRSRSAKVHPALRPQAVPVANVGAGFGGALQAPQLLQPSPGYPVNGQLGNYNLPVTHFGQIATLAPGQLPAGGPVQCYQGMCQQMPGYLAYYNRAIPGFNGNQQPQGFNILTYGPQGQPQQPQAQAQQGQQPNLGSLANIFNGMANPNNRTQGSPYNGSNSGTYSGNDSGSGRSDGGSVNSGPDGLCRGGQNTFQTTARSELGGISPCDTIYNTITQDSCTAGFADQLGRQDTRDMENFCPGWNQIKGDPTKRALALMNLVAAVVRTESGWRNGATGDGGKSKGMLQLTTSTDRRHGCSCGQLSDEFNMQQNLRCGTQMIVSFMARDRAVGHGSGEHCGGDASNCGAQGIARSFGPFRDGRGERGDIQRRISQWCRESLQNATPPSAPAPAISQPAPQRPQRRPQPTGEEAQGVG